MRYTATFNIAFFFQRFGKYLQSSDLSYFEHKEDDYEMKFYLKEIAYRCSNSQVIIKNRRFAAMQELDKAGELIVQNYSFIWAVSDRLDNRMI